MMRRRPARKSWRCPIDLEQTLAFLAGELPAGQAETLESHVFDCERCGPAFERVAGLREAVAEAVRNAEVAGNVDLMFVERASHEGLKMCEYRITEGGKVSCKAGAEDFVVVRLAADFDDVEKLRLDVDFQDLERRISMPLPTRDVVVDREHGEVFLLFPGDTVRGYPRSQWTIRIHGERLSAEGEVAQAEIGPFVMDHTP